MGFSIVLHGHKHTAAEYYDYIADPERSAERPGSRVLVVSGSTIGGADTSRDDACRLIEVESSRLAPRALIRPVRAVDSGDAIELPEPRRRPLWTAPSSDAGRRPGPTTIRGTDIDEVYARLMQVANDTNETSPLLDIICHVAEPAMRLPIGYPNDVLEGRAPDDWLIDIVGWWQKRGRARRHGGVLFSHGDRILAFDNEVNQLEIARDVLLSDGVFNGRAVVSLLDPRIDHVGVARRHKFPAFVAAQFIKRMNPQGGFCLDCVGYFRKQELRYWWPVNIAELHHMQNELIDMLGDEVSPGSVTTFTAISYAGQSQPRVAVPLVDQFYEEDRNRLFRLAFGLCLHSPGDTEELKDDWRHVLEGLIPPERRPAADPPIALDGLRALSGDLGKVAAATSNVACSNLRSKLDSIHQSNRDFADRLVDGIQDAEYNGWRDLVTGLVRAALEDVERALA